VAAGSYGDLGIMPGHAPLLTTLESRPVWLKKNGDEDLSVSGGFPEVQPHRVTVLANTATRADLDEEAALKKLRNDARELLLTKT
jgi:F-type H+-transporting ATPase subunit epsilon